MIKIFNANDRDFSTAGNIIIEPIKCIEYKKKSLNGWYIEVEIPIKYKEYISKDKLCVVKTKSKLNPQAFRVGEDIQYTTRKIKFKAEHVMFDAKDYVLLDVRPTNQNGLNALNYINGRTDNPSPFIMHSNVENTNTAYFIRKNLLEAWTTVEERWEGVFDADNWKISFLTSVGNDNGETIAYGKNMQGFDIYEDWSSVCTKICPVGYDGIMLKETYLESDVQYEKPYTRVIDFQTSLETEKQTKENLLVELRQNAETYLEENKTPKVSYTVISNINEKLEIGDTIKVLHPFVEIFTEVLEYEYDLISKKVKSLTFGNYNRDVKTKFDNIKNSITEINQALSKQEVTINTQTNLINTLNKNGYVYIDDNEILILDSIPKEDAKNIWRFGLGGIGFSSNGYEGPFEIAITMDGQINADFITTGTLNVSRIEGLAGALASIEIEMDSISQTVGQQNQKISVVEQTVNELNSKISDIADITTSKESTNGAVSFEKINQSEPIYVKIYPTGENISYLYPHSNLFPSEILFLKVRTLRFTNTTTNEYFDYELPTDLLYYDAENYDEFILDYDAQSCVVNKKVGYNADGTTYVLETPSTIEYEYPRIILTDGDYTVTLLGYENAYMFVRLMAQNIYTTQFATKAELNSEIKQTVEEIDLSVNKKLMDYSTTEEMNSAINVKADSITSSVSRTYATKTENTNTLNSAKGYTDKQVTTAKSEIKQTTDSISSEVSKKVGNNEVISKINQSAETVQINANKISLDGKEINLTSDDIVIKSNNFNVDKYGNLSCNDANITGTIDAGSTITGASIVGSSIRAGDYDDFYVYKDGTVRCRVLHVTNSTDSNSTSFTVTNEALNKKITLTAGDILFGKYKTSSTNLTLSNLGESGHIYCNGTIEAKSFSNISCDKEKENIHKLNGQSKNKKVNRKALDIIKDADVCEYNYKGTNNTTIGLVIGNDYKTPDEVLNEKKNGIDLYSMSSLSWKGLQEAMQLIEKQDKQIKQLQKEISELKRRVNNNE